MYTWLFLVIVLFFDLSFFYVVLTVLELTLQTKTDLELRSTYLCLLSDGLRACAATTQIFVCFQIGSHCVALTG